MALIREIKYNVTLSHAQIERVWEQVINKSNRLSACQYAGISTNRLDSILTGAKLKNEERDLLMKFCDIVEGINENGE